MRTAQAPASATVYRRIGALAMLAMLAFGTPMAAIHPNQPQGFDGDRAAQRGLDQIDQIDLFTGRLAVVLPLGPFALVYNSNIWRYEAVLEGGEEHIRSNVDNQNTGGIGWRIGLGEVYRPQHSYNVTGHWLYVSDDGGRHLFYDTLHNDDNNAQAGVWYTRDGSYLRMKKTTSFYVDIESPDGTTRRFLTGAASDPTIFRLHKVWSRFTSADDPDLWVSRDENDLRRTVHDRHGREHHIQLTDEFAPRFPRTVTQLDIESFGGQRLIYDFEYWNKWVDVSCKQSSPSSPSRIRVPHLKRIDNRGDDTAYTFFEEGELMYYNVCQDGIEDLPGILNGVNLPTGGKIRWAFQEYEFPPAETNSVFNSSAGVASRTLLNADGTPYGGGNSTWTYKTKKLSAAQTGGHPEVHTEVVNPTDDCTQYFFDAIYWRNAATGEGWEVGLPFTYTEPVAGADGVAARYLSSRIFPSNDGDGSCDGEPLRSTYLRFRHDLTPGPSAPIGDWPNLNRHMQASRIVYHDDEDRYADTEFSDFDGLGHFRRTVTTGTFREDSKTAERRESMVHYNRVAGTYGTAGYEPPAPEDPWVLQIFDSTEITEGDAAGETTARIEYGFESDTGFLFCTRTFANGSERGVNDLMRVFERDELGQVTDVKRFGGDRQPLDTEGADCGLTPAEPAYWVTHTYGYGKATSSRPRTADGGEWPFLTYDVDLDPSTGWVVNQRNEAGLMITFDYDVAGRLRTVTPPESATAAYSYSNAEGVLLSKTKATSQSMRGQTQSESEVVFDAFGRVVLERRLLPGGSWSEREILRNARGWKTSISKWGDRDQTTQYLEFDPFGRPEVVRPPEGAKHDIGFTYQGARRVTRVANVALAGGGDSASRTSEFDRYGRRRLLEEASGPAGAITATTYTYDVGGRRTEIRSGSQVRSFVYDNRGFLLSETHPELGAIGNGTVLHLDYDASGLAHRVVEGPNDIIASFDLLGRPIETRDTHHGNRLITLLEYDDAAGAGAGKLWRATRYNYVDLPWNAVGEEPVRIQNEYSYEGFGGSGSRQTTRVMDWDLGTVTFREDFTYDQNGQLSQITYPACTLAACAGTTAGTGRQVAYTYDQGLLTEVDGWATRIEYHPSGMWRLIEHGNGVIDHQDQDPGYSFRPSRLYTTNVMPATANFDTGVMSYDGSGNLKASGGDRFLFDGVNRLVEASLLGGNLQQSYVYDRFGNLTETTTDDFGAVETETHPVDEATNRLTGDVSYDAAGNLTSWNGLLFTYDTSNRLTRQAWMTYLYDAAGERVAKIPNVGPGHVTVSFQLRGRGQRVLSNIVLNNGQWRRDTDYIYAGHRLLARVEQTTDEVAYHVHLDHLGSQRLTTDSDGTARFAHRFLPYGEEWPQSQGTTAEDPMLFTGHERDSSVGTDYMHARHYSSALGRFLSVDPIRGPSGVPQRLNRYAYAVGNPLRYIDPDGRSAQSANHEHGIGCTNQCVINELGSDLAGIDEFGKYYFGMWAAAAGGAAAGVTRGMAVRIMSTSAVAAGGEDIIVKRDFKSGIDKGIHGAFKGFLLSPLVGLIKNPTAQEAAKIGLWAYIYGSTSGAAEESQEDEDANPIATFSEEITTTANHIKGQKAEGTEQVEEIDGDDEEADTGPIFFCSATGGCVEVTEEEVQAQLRAFDSIHQLRQFGCLLSPTTCFAGFGNRQGFGSTGYTGSLQDLYF